MISLPGFKVVTSIDVLAIVLDVEDEERVIMSDAVDVNEGVVVAAIMG